MTQAERQTFLIQKLLDEQQRYKDIEIPQDTAEQKRLLRSLFNVRSPKDISDDFLNVQDEYLREEAAAKGVTDLADLSPISAGLSTSAGFTYSGERFRRYFAGFEDKYGFHDMHSGGFAVMTRGGTLCLLEPFYYG